MNQNYETSHSQNVRFSYFKFTKRIISGLYTFRLLKVSISYQFQ